MMFAMMVQRARGFQSAFILVFLSFVPTLFASSQNTNTAKCKDVETPEFERFNREFISAIQRKDASALAFLIKFPLRVNTSRGTIDIEDAESLAGHFDQVFTSRTREDILSTGTNSICRYDEGISYGRGAAWISNSDTVEPKNGRPMIALYVVNVMDDPPAPLPRLVYTCRTEKHRITIDELPKDKFRYRSWDQHKPLSDPPDLDLTNGTVRFEGTGVCATPTYSFHRGDTDFEVNQGLGCTDGSDPKEATGHLTVKISGKTVTDTWCF